jgi:UDP-2,4-diacetamido-2,4,6-trideoxy-beta-L-altropyranose hydrolase
MLTKTVVIRADASIYIGSGHIMRCLVLAEALKNQGYKIYFATRPQKGDLINLIENRGFQVRELVCPKNWRIPEDSADYSAWLQVPWQEDAESLVKNFESIDLVIVDHYGLNHGWEDTVKSHYGCKILALDDLVRNHKADLIVDQTLLRDVNEYKYHNTDSTILAGCRYALLNSKFISYRKIELQKNRKLSEPIKVLLSMGGIDAPNATLKVLKAMSAYVNRTQILITVLLSSKAPNYRSVKEFCLNNYVWVNHIDFVDDMAELLSQQCVAIGAPGGSSWERACLGIPSIIVPLADNQKTISNNLSSVGASLPIDINDIETKLLSTFDLLIERWEILRKANLSICDGKGVMRVVQGINTLMNEQKNVIELRDANEADIQLVYNWQTMSETRKYALNTKVPIWEEHKRWMSAKLNVVQDFFYIIESLYYGESIGVLRLDRQERDEYIISIFITPKYFGQGFAKKVLTFVDIIHPEITIKATVLKDNIASQRLFKSANYHKKSSDTFIRPPLTEKIQ